MSEQIGDGLTEAVDWSHEDRSAPDHPGARRRLGSLGLDEDVEHLTDRAFLGDGFSKRQMRLDLVAVATAVFVLHHVAALGQVGDDAVGAALGDTQRRGDVAQAHPGVVGDAHEDPSMVGEEAPLGHGVYILAQMFLEIYC